MERKKRSDQRLFMLLLLLIVFSLGYFLQFLAPKITPLLLFSTSTQTDFNEGVYFNTEYNTSGFVQLVAGQSLGNYTSKVFDAGNVSQWKNISFIGELPYGQELKSNYVNSPNYARIPDTTGNVLLFHFENNSDLSRNNNNGVINGATNTSGKFGSALSFDGINDYVTVQDSTNLKPNDVTVEAWVKGGAQGTFKYIVSKNYDVAGASYGLYSGAAGGLVFYVRWGALSTDFTVSSDAGDIWDDKWHHVVGMFANSKLRLFVDGKEISPAVPVSLPIIYNTNNLYIGSSDGVSPNFFFTGTIDEVAIYNRTLSEQEILDHYKIGISTLKFYISTCVAQNCADAQWENINEGFSTPFYNTIYLQYKVDFSTEDTQYSPQLYNVTIGYELNVTQTNLSMTSISLLQPINNSGDTDGFINFSYSISSESNVEACSLLINATKNISSTDLVPSVNYNLSIDLDTGLYSWQVNCSKSGQEFKSEERRLYVMLTDFTISDLSNVSSIKGLTIENEYGKIDYANNTIDLAGANIDDIVYINFNRIEVNASLFPALNKSANLTLYDLTYIDPQPLKGGVVCTSCKEINYSNGTFTFSIPSFTVYSAGESAPITIVCGDGIISTSENCDFISGTPIFNWNATCKTVLGTGYIGKLDCYKVTESLNLRCKYDKRGCFVEEEEEICTSNWNCTAWSSCIGSTQTRTCACDCVDLRCLGDSSLSQTCVGGVTTTSTIRATTTTFKQPSCYDGIKNQNEESADCGGPCSPCKKEFSLKSILIPTAVGILAIILIVLLIYLTKTIIKGKKKLVPIKIEKPGLKERPFAERIQPIVYEAPKTLLTGELDDYVKINIQNFKRSEVEQKLLNVGWDKELIAKAFEALEKEDPLSKLVPYIRDALTKGYTEMQIRDVLVRKGWTQDVLNKAFNLVR